MKKQINIETFAIKEIRLVATQKKEDDETITEGWDALIQYNAEDASGASHYAKTVRFSLTDKLVSPLVDSLSQAIDTFETNPPAPVGAKIK